MGDSGSVNQMINKLASVTAGVLLGATALSGCGGASDVAADAGPPDAAAPGTLLWALQLGGDGDDWATVATDPDGNVWIVGSFTSSIDFGDGVVQSLGDRDAFVAKYSAGGELHWWRVLGGLEDDVATAVAVDGADTVLVVGWFRDSVDLGNGVVTNNVGDDGFVVAYDADDGSHVWSRTFASVGTDRANGVAVDSAGDVVVVGSFEYVVDFGGGDLGATFELPSAFAAKYMIDDGTHRWSSVFRASQGNEALAVTTDRADNVIITGEFIGAADFGGPELWAGGEEVFVAKFDPPGEHIWSRNPGGSHRAAGRAIAVDSANDIFVAGGFRGTVQFGSNSLTSTPGDMIRSIDGFVAGYSAASTPLWAAQTGSPGDNQLVSVSAGADGDVWIGGYYEDTLLIGEERPSAGAEDGVVVRYRDGDAIWSFTFGGAGSDVATGVVQHLEQSVVISAVFSETIEIEGRSFESTGGDILVVALAL